MKDLFLVVELPGDFLSPKHVWSIVRCLDLDTPQGVNFGVVPSAVCLWFL
jgi:hypothetical protein